MKPKKKTTYRPDGSVSREIWYLDGKRHRTDGPAWIGYFPDGSVSYEVWCVNDERHRTDGPAWISYSEDGSVRCEVWYLDGKELTEEQFVARRRKLIIDSIIKDR
jgi:uncharacterized protein